MTKLALIAVCLLSFAQVDGTTSNLAGDVRRLVKQLDGRDLSARVKAEEALVELGPAALEHLPEATPKMSAELRQRVGRIRQRLFERQVAESSEMSTVTLSGNGMPLGEVFAAIEEQTGNKVIDLREKFGQEAAAVKVDVDFQKTPFWKALDTVLAQANMVVYPYSESKSVGVINRASRQSMRQAHVAYDGPFRVEATDIHASRNFRDSDAGSLRVTLEVAWEPRLAPIVLEQSLGDVTVEAASGETIKVTSPEGSIEAQISPSSNATELTIPLALPPRSVAKISALKGTLQVLLPGRAEKFEFTDLLSAKGVEQRKASAIVTVDQVRKNNQIWEVYMRLRFDDAAGALDSHRGWFFNNKAYLVNPKGEAVEFGGFETTKQSPDEIGIAYFFDIPEEPKDYKFVYETPATVLSTPVEYTIENLELP